MRTSITKDPGFAPQLRAALTDLPSISLSTRETINDTTEVRTAFEWIRPDGKPGVHEDCGIQRFGGAFTDFAKKSFRLYFRAEDGAAKLTPLFEGFDRGWAPTDEFDQLELRSGSHDMAMRGFYLSNPVTDDTLLEMGDLNPHGRFVHLYLNGQYWGVYHLRERCGASMHSRYLGGSKDDYESINGNWNVGGWADPVSAGEIVFSQLNIQPSGPGDTEYVELQNVVGRTVNLRGCRFTDGIEFAFAPNRDWLMAPGDRRVLVRDVFGFRQRFGIDVPVTGVYRGSPNNGGETLVLSDARGTALCTATYDRAEGWPQATGPG